MAKQTFTTGQVLTAAQMTSLQQTAMLGGAASAKTASYTLVAADAGTAISMSNASATTITVNTGLFAAGDTVFIQNIGAGACTITAGTATVATAGSLILPQNDAGILYFTATGTATFYDFIQAGAVSPLTTKGDVYTFSTSDARLAVGANDTVLTADSAQATGLKWATPTAGGMTLISTTSLTGASITLSSIPSTYKNLQLIVRNYYAVNDGNRLNFRFNADATSNRHVSLSTISGTGSFNGTATNATNGQDNAASQGLTVIDVFDYANTTTWKFFRSSSIANDQTSATDVAFFTAALGAYNQTGAISSIELFPSSSNFTAGSVLLYGVK